MARVDWTPEPENDFKPGAYLVEVLDAQEKRSSSSGALMFSIRLGAVDFESRTLCFDNLMLEGKGRGMGTKKLQAFGIQEGAEEVLASQLEGKRAYVFVVEDEYKGKKSLKPALKKGTHCGYWLESDRDSVEKLHQNIPANAGEENPFLSAAEDDDTPF